MWYFPMGFAHEHCVEGGYFIHSHRGHLQHLRYLVHGGDGKPSVLPLG
uniref:Uncharacterized protein n=1 Tax=Anguilla anguilla TaxID=7936 RepID=A0A0E9VSR9_ANGAN